MPGNYGTFSKTAFTVNSDPGATVSSRFDSAKPGIETTTSCVPVLTFTIEGVLPMYCPSIEISASAGVEVKLHFTSVCLPTAPTKEMGSAGFGTGSALG